MINIIALYNNNGVGYHRVLKPMQCLEYFYPNDFNILYIDISNTKDAPYPLLYGQKWDVIFFNTMLGLKDNDPMLVALERVLDGGAKIVMDIDDHFELGKSVIIDNKTRTKYKDSVPEALLVADYITTTTNTFKELISEYNPNVEVFHNFADSLDQQYNCAKTELYNSNGDKIIRLGFTPSAMHSFDMKLVEGIAGTLRRSEYKDRFQIVLAGYANNSVYHQYERMLTDNYKTVSKPYKNKLHSSMDAEFINTLEPYSRIQWKSPSEYIKSYSEIDVLLAPLENTRFNAVKSPIKYVEAGYTYTLFVGSDVPAYNQYVKHGVNGLLCKSKYDFNNTVLRIMEEWESTRGFAEIKSAAFVDIITNHEAEVVSEKRYDFFKSIIKK